MLLGFVFNGHRQGGVYRVFHIRNEEGNGISLALLQCARKGVGLVAGLFNCLYYTLLRFSVNRGSFIHNSGYSAYRNAGKLCNITYICHKPLLCNENVFKNLTNTFLSLKG